MKFSVCYVSSPHHTTFQKVIDVARPRAEGDWIPSKGAGGGGCDEMNA